MQEIKENELQVIALTAVIVEVISMNSVQIGKLGTVTAVERAIVIVMISNVVKLKRH